MNNSFWSVITDSDDTPSLLDFDKISCSYHDPSKFDSSKINDGNKLSILNFNIRSISKNFDNFITFLNGFNVDFDILILTETWLNADNKDLFNIPNYNSYHATRHGRGGGVSIFVKASINSKEVVIDVENDSSLEYLFVELPQFY